MILPEDTRKAAFSFKRLAHALLPSVFDSRSGNHSSPQAPTTPALTGIGAGNAFVTSPMPTGFGGGGKQKRQSSGIAPAMPEGARKRNTSDRVSKGDDEERMGARSNYSLSPTAIEQTISRGSHTDKRISSSAEGLWAALLKQLGIHALRLWMLLLAFYHVVRRGGRWTLKKLGIRRHRRRAGLSNYARRAGSDDSAGGDQRQGGNDGVRQSSELSLSDDSQNGTPTLNMRGLVVPMQGDRRNTSKKRRNVYYDVEEASYRPMHRLLFMRERSINPVSQKKYEAAAAATQRGEGGVASPLDGGPPAHSTRQVSEDMLSGIMSSPSPMARGEYALAMGGGDSAQVLLASPIAGLGAAEGGGGGGGAEENAAADGATLGETNPATAPGEEQLSAAEGGYFAGKYGDKVCDGTFILVSQLGSGAFSTVWLAIDVKGATSALGPGLMFQNRMDDTRYNATAAVMKQGFAFVVLKISRSALPYRQACEKEFETHQQLYLRLQREGFDVSKFLLFPLSMREQVPRGPCHSVQVGAACGPSLLSFVLHAAPNALASAEDKLWRMRFIRQFMRNAIEGLSQLHSCGILHTDVKPENLLLTLPAYEVLRKMKAEPMLRDGKGRLYRASRGSAAASAAGQASSTTKESDSTKATPNASTSTKPSASLSTAPAVTLSGLTEEEEEHDRDLIFAKHRLDIINGVGAWVTLRARHSVLMATEESDVVEALGSIKVADLGNAVFLSNVRVAELQLKPNPSISERNELLMATTATGAAGPYGAAAGGVPDPTALQQTAQYFQAAAAAHAFQTREYRAPEIIVGVEPLTRLLTPAMDVWSIGCLVFELITGSYLFNPHAAVQQEIASGVQPRDPEFRHNEVHLSMMQEICSNGPSMPRRHRAITNTNTNTNNSGENASGPSSSAQTPTSSGTYSHSHMMPPLPPPPTTSSSAASSHVPSAAHTPTTGAGADRRVPDVIRKQGRMSEALFRNMLPIAPEGMNGEPLLQLILEQRTFCDVNHKGEDESFKRELAKVAQMLGSIFRWDPLDRPSMADLLAMPWLQDDGCS